MKRLLFVSALSFLLFSSTVMAVTPSSHLIIVGVEKNEDVSFYYYSDIVIYNPNDYSVSIRVNFLQGNVENADPLSVEFILQPFTTERYYDALLSLFDVTNGWGAFEFFAEGDDGENDGVSSNIIATGIHFWTSKDTGQILTATAIPAIPAKSASTSVSFIGMAWTGWEDQGVFIIYNVGDESATVRINAYYGNDGPFVKQEFQIRPKEIVRTYIVGIGPGIKENSEAQASGGLRFEINADQPIVGGLMSVDMYVRVTWFEMITLPDCFLRTKELWPE